MKLLTILVIIHTTMANHCMSNSHYAIVLCPAPVLNTSDFESVFGGLDGSRLKKDNKGLIRSVEYIALTGTI
jgi:hypothetical protein